MIGIIVNMSGFIRPNCETEVNIFSFGGGKIARETGVTFLGRAPCWILKSVESDAESRL
jgi:Mrp family chromosome partitioning ATPase